MASYTRTVQFSPGGTSGNLRTADGDGLDTRMGLDLMLGVNNLAYTYPWAAFVQPEVESAISQTGAVDAEFFAFECPTMLPRDGFRFSWTLGLYVTNDSSIADAVFTDVNLYLAPDPYRGAADAVFDVGQMGQPYGLSTVTFAETIPQGTSDLFRFADMSAGVTGNWAPFVNSNGGDLLVPANLIVTFTGHLNDPDFFLSFLSADFSSWISPE